MLTAYMRHTVPPRYRPGRKPGRNLDRLTKRLEDDPMGDPMQDATDAMTLTEPVYPMPPTELVKGFNILDTKRQVELLAYLEEACEEQMLQDWQLLEK